MPVNVTIHHSVWGDDRYAGLAIYGGFPGGAEQAIARMARLWSICTELQTDTPPLARIRSCLGGARAEEWLVAAELGERLPDDSIRVRGVDAARPPSGRSVYRVPLAWTTYAIEAVGSDSIKIGKAVDVERRLEVLQIGCPFPLRLLAAILGDSETTLHRRFEHLRIRGEWFRAEPELRHFLSGEVP